ncbi:MULTISPECIES: Maf family nucleotide pyrophosphatase [unclassified Breznakia]|uniref:Maf family protein n=1 Tax=unclassified Breznakia TaxID=2623764 RepID=UPI002473E027|nr:MULTISPECIES: Maf family nucleotide pyrophosphatase [unclassified Breznakia]MDH6367737.1 septum formation protein [Breznakia sp. PH1-1]MDH6404825.1 septum formation protein [Breznakia sp. PF1-11]MDH6412549.1 septum formation protein [Breznakia sp. PFB1-11]MDH6414900.1 septum formation protein [Breznakia sp. PFB1-14]MDH6417220.1 septum formation protein [Breznakia sp. PFB1-4]
MKIVLATTAKHKSEILTNAHIYHTCRKGDFAEVKNIENPKQRAIANATGKAQSIHPNSDEVVIGLDTFVVFENQIFEKPRNTEEARNRLRQMSGRTNEVYTGICIIDSRSQTILTDVAKTKVTFFPISDKNIDLYIKSEPNLIHSTGYIIEHMLSCFIKSIEGEYYNILGVPCAKIYAMLASIGYEFGEGRTK